MEALTLSEVAVAVGGRCVGACDPVSVGGVATDSREIRPGDLFVCLEGPRFDGHAFASEARARGAAALISHHDLPDDVGPLVRVSDTQAALAALARRARRELSEALVIGITGSNGKTSTKDLTAAALATGLVTVRSERSFNNAIGVPLTLLATGRDTEAVVAEIGTNAPGEIAQLAALVRPQIGVITNIQPAHLHGLGSLAGVLEEKSALLDALEGRAVAVLNRDDPCFDALAARAPGPVVSYGQHPEADVVATEVRCDTSGTRFVVDGRVAVHVRHLGRHTVGNGLAAIATACAAGLPLAGVAQALAGVPAPPGRLQVRRLGGLTVIDDTWNANPGSLAAAASVVSELSFDGRLFMAVGDMLELGEEGRALHEEAGRKLAACGPTLLLAIGRHAQAVVDGARAAGLDADRLACCADADEAAATLRRHLRAGDTVLVKGSRGMRLEGLVSALVDVSASVA